MITLIDIPGADPSLPAEERGQAFAIAENLEAMALLRTPLLAVIIGEGGSGGALALALADRVLMLEHAIFSVASPEAARDSVEGRRAGRGGGGGAQADGAGRPPLRDRGRGHP